MFWHPGASKMYLECILNFQKIWRKFSHEHVEILYAYKVVSGKMAIFMSHVKNQFSMKKKLFTNRFLSSLHSEQKISVSHGTLDMHT